LDIPFLDHVAGEGGKLEKEACPATDDGVGHQHGLLEYEAPVGEPLEVHLDGWFTVSPRWRAILNLQVLMVSRPCKIWYFHLYFGLCARYWD